MPDKIPFDYLGARKEGYSDEEIMGFLKKNYGFDFDLVGAKKEGYSDEELAQYISTYDVKKKEAAPATGTASSLGANIGRVGAAAVGNATSPSTSTSTSPSGLPLFGAPKAKPTDKIGVQVQQNEEKRRAEAEIPRFNTAIHLDQDLDREIGATLSDPAIHAPKDKTSLMWGYYQGKQQKFEQEKEHQKAQIKSDPKLLADYTRKRAAELDEEISRTERAQGALQKGAYGGALYTTDSKKSRELEEEKKRLTEYKGALQQSVAREAITLLAPQYLGGQAAPRDLGRAIVDIADPEQAAEMRLAESEGQPLPGIRKAQLEQVGIESIRSYLQANQDHPDYEVMKARLDADEADFAERNFELTAQGIREEIGAQLRRQGKQAWLGFGYDEDALREAFEATNPSEAKRRVFETYVLPTEQKIFGTGVPTGGFTKSAYNAVERSAQGTVKTVQGLVGTRSDADRAQEGMSGEGQRYEAPKSRTGWQSIVDGMGDLTGQVAMMALTTKGIGATGAALKASTAGGITGGLTRSTLGAVLASENVGLFISSYLTSYDNYRTSAVQAMPQASASDRAMYARFMATVEGLSEKIFNDTKVLKAFTGKVSPAIADITRRLSVGEITSQAAQKELSQAIKASAKTFGKEFAVSTGQNASEEAIVDVAEGIAQSVFGDKPLDMVKTGEQAARTFITTALHSPLIAGLAAAGKVRQGRAQNAFFKASLVDMGRNPTAYLQAVEGLQLAGEITPEQAGEKVALIQGAAQALQNAPQGLDAPALSAYVLHTLNGGERSAAITEGLANGTVQVTEDAVEVTNDKEVAETLDISFHSDFMEEELTPEQQAEVDREFAEMAGDVSPQVPPPPSPSSTVPQGTAEERGEMQAPMERGTLESDKEPAPIEGRTPVTLSGLTENERLGRIEQRKAETALSEEERRVNIVFDKIKEYNELPNGRLGKHKPEGRQLLNQIRLEASELGYTFDERAGRLRDSKNKVVRPNYKAVGDRSIGEGARVLRDRTPEVQETFERLLDAGALPATTRLDGKTMSAREIEGAVDDITNGIPSQRATRYLDALEEWVTKDLYPTEGNRALPLNELLGVAEEVQGEPMSEEALLQWLQDESELDPVVEEIIYDNLDEILQDYEQNNNGAEASAPAEVSESETGTEDGSSDPTEPAGETTVSEPEVAAEVIDVSPQSDEATGTPGGPPPTDAGSAGSDGPRLEDLSGIKKALVPEAVRDTVDFARLTDTEMMARGRELIDSGVVKPRELINRIVTDGRGVLTPEEVVALIVHKADLDNALRAAYKKKNEALEKGEEFSGTADIQDLELQLYNYQAMALITANNQSLAFRLRQQLLDSGYNALTQIERYKAANNGYIDPATEAFFKEKAEAYQRTRDAIMEAGEKIEQQEGQEAIQNIQEDLVRKGELSEEEVERRVQEGVQREIDKLYQALDPEKKSLADKAIAALEKIQKNLRSKNYSDPTLTVAFIDAGITTIKNAIKAGVAVAKAVEMGVEQIKRAMGGTWAKAEEFRRDMLDAFQAEGVDTKVKPEPVARRNKKGELIIPPAIIRGFVKNGETTIEGLTEKVLEVVKDSVPDATARQVRDAITGYGREVNPTKDDLTTKLNQMRRVGKLISELEDLQAGIAREKNPAKKAKRTAQEEELLRQIRALSPEAGREVDQAAKARREEERKLQSALDAAQESLNEYERRIRELDFSPKEKKQGPTSPELEDLRKKRDEKRKEYEELKKQQGPKKTDAQRLSEAKTRLKTRIKDMETRIAKGEYTKKKPQPVKADDEYRTLLKKADQLGDEIEKKQYEAKLKNRTPGEKIEDWSKELLNAAVRGLTAAGDLSFMLIQGGKRWLTAPIQSIRATGKAFQAYGREKWVRDFESTIKTDPLYADMKRDGVAFQFMDGKHASREDVVISADALNKLIDWALGMIDRGVSLATIGKVSREQSHKVTKFLNIWKNTAWMFNAYMNSLRYQAYKEGHKYMTNKKGVTPETAPKDFKKMADNLNTLSSRASMGKMETSAEWLNILMFSARKVVSELKLFTPYVFVYYARMPKYIRRRAATEFVQGVSTLIAVNAAVWAMRTDWDDEDEPDQFWNPLSSNFLSHKVGTTYVDLTGGLRTMLVFQARLFSGKYTDSKGKTEKLGERFGKPINTRWNLITEFSANKFAPTFSAAKRWADQRKGQEIDWSEEGKQLSTFLWTQDLDEIYNDHPGATATFLTGMAVMGAAIRADEERAVTAPETIKHNEKDVKLPANVRAKMTEMLTNMQAEKKTALEALPEYQAEDLEGKWHLEETVRRRVKNKVEDDIKKANKQLFPKPTSADKRKKLKEDRALEKVMKKLDLEEKQPS